MAEFRYYAIHNDVFDWLKEIAGLGQYHFALGIKYSEPKAIEFDDPTLLDAEKFAEARYVYIFSERYSIFPIVFDGPYRKNNGMDSYSMSALVGGPSLHLSISPMWEESPKRRTTFVDLSYQPFFGNPTREMDYRKPPEALKQAYKELRSLIQRKCVKCKINFSESEIKTAWFGRHTFEMIQAQELFIDQGKYPAIGIDRISVIRKLKTKV